MSIDEQELIKQKYYPEAIRYMDNAKEILKKAGKEDKYYNDRKYVRIACGAAYHGVLIALDAYLLLKGIEKKKGRKSVEYYNENIGKSDKKLLRHLVVAYDTLHLSGYYDGNLSYDVIKTGFDEAYEIIDQIKPDN
ncbi:hypothetical protein EZS27_009381 [termite gut metagenome]|uniref:DUF5618 domain-containing protein n=1 Tax=termite gut metagenome TaxID=433724 RepID=A0A5J4SCE0_9ZZZZ